uniref:Obg domain-containing protein n=2 Tax=Caenorhabditis japonica TaxID=281687 RepID=A0A8R1IJ12_CAEJA
MRITCNLRETVARVQKLIKNDFNIVTIDQFKINVKAGNGGPGLARYNGVGGTGGNVYFVAKPSMAFIDIKKELNSKMRIRAQNGDSSSKTSLLGSNGKHE